MDNLFKPKNIPFQKLEEFVQVNFDEYESPISVYLNERYRPHQQMVNDIVEAVVFKEILAVGVNVDKGELLKALAYDRNQYGKGYAAGVRAAVPKWISVEERLPDIENENGTAKCTETVVGVDKLGYQYVGFFRVYKCDNSFEFVGCDCDGFDRGEFDVTHWMPLPEPPKEE